MTAMTFTRRRTHDRVHAALPADGAVTPREAWRRAGAIGAPASVYSILRALEREGRAIRAGRAPDNGARAGANLWRRIG